MPDALTGALGDLQSFLQQGGPAMWVIAALSVLTVALILWKVWRLSALGAWSGARARRATALWLSGDTRAAEAVVANGGGLRARVVRSAFATLNDSSLTEAKAREETERVARIELVRARAGLRALELIATIAPLVGLLGTVLGMIEAFQALQEAGSRADPSDLAGGIWEALLTTAAGMAVAIPASAGLAWFESVADRVQGDMEDLATQIFSRTGSPRPIGPSERTAMERPRGGAAPQAAE